MGSHGPGLASAPLHLIQIAQGLQEAEQLALEAEAVHGLKLRNRARHKQTLILL